jgi:hypothetical protein
MYLEIIINIIIIIINYSYLKLLEIQFLRKA